MHAAVQQSAEVMAPRDRPELGLLGAAAAALRFNGVLGEATKHDATRRWSSRRPRTPARPYD